MKIDRLNWQPVRFGDIVRQAGGTNQRPTDERVVGLEHLDSDALTVRRYAPSDADHTFTRKFSKGQVLYGKRRAYQRKAARVDFDGVCSNDIIVMEPASRALHASLLPILVQSPSFLEHALATSVGSLSPRTNWKSLGDFYFNLPPIEDQVKIADLVWAAEEVAVKAEAAVEVAWTVEKRVLEDAYADPTWPVVRMEDAGEIQLGKKLSPKSREGQQTPYLRVANIGDDHLVLDEVHESPFTPREVERLSLQIGDLLLIEANGNIKEVGRSAIWGGEIEGCCFQNHVFRLRVKEGILPEFAYGWLRRANYRGDFARQSTRTTTLANITAVRFGAMDFPLPSQDVQNEVVRRVVEAREARRALEEHARASRRLVRGLIDRIFSEDVPPDELQRGQQRS